MKRGKLLSILLCLLVVLFPSCNGESSTPEATGSITVKIEDSTTPQGGGIARGVEPQNLEVASYEILASGPDGAELSATAEKNPVESTIHTFSNVAPGNWSITINAKAEGGEKIGSGTAYVTVTPGQNANCSVEVKELQGEGEINFNITDSTGALTALTAEISTNNETITTIELKEDKDNIFSGSAEVDNGFYMVSIKAGGNEILKVDSVRVYAGITTVYSGTYDGETIDVTITDEIVKTPDLTLAITSGTSVAANGTLTASASVTNLESPSYSWYINGTKLEISTDSELSYAIEGSEYAAGETLEVTVFVSNGSVIWSESKTVTVTEAVTLPSEVTISQDKTAYGSEITLSYETDENIPEGTAATWTVNGTTLESDTFTPSIIGHEIPVSLTLNAGGVTQTYTSAIEINPEVTIKTDATDVPENAIIAVNTDIQAPDGYTIVIIANESERNLSNGKIALDNLEAGGVTLGWKLTFNDEEEWTGTSDSALSIIASKATDAPDPTTDESFGGITEKEKLAFVQDVLANISTVETPYETTEGFSNLDGTVKKNADSYTFGGCTFGEYLFWGTKNDTSTNVTVQNSTDEVFIISSQDGIFTLNGVEIKVAPPKPEVNTDSSFGGSASEKYVYVMSILEEVMQADLSQIGPNPDGDGWLLDGFATDNYILWGVAVTDDSTGYPISLDVTIQNANSEVFTVILKDGVFYLNGVECKEKEPEPLEGPEEPTEHFVNSGVSAGTEELGVYSAVLTAFASPNYPMSVIATNIPDEMDKTIGNYHMYIKGGVAKYTVVKDYEISISDQETVTVKAGSFNESYMEDDSNATEIIFEYKGEEYTYSQPRWEYSILKKGEEIIDDQNLLSIADHVDSDMNMEAAMLIFTPEGLEGILGKDLMFMGNMIMNIDSFSMKTDAGGDISNIDMDYLVSVMDLPIQNGEYGEMYTISSVGMRITGYVNILNESPTGEIIIHGPATINGVEYYFDVTSTPAVLTGGIKVNGVWKAVTV